MRTVEDAEGRRYLAVKESRAATLVRDPATGEARYVPAGDLEDVDGIGPLETAASGIPAPVRRLVTAAHDDRGLGLLVELVRRGPLAARAVLDGTDLCESDLAAYVGEFRAAGLLETTDVSGEPGYRATATAETAVEALQSAGSP